MSLFWGRTKFCWYQITSVCEWIYVWHMLFFDWQKSDLFHFLCEETSQMVHYVCHMAKSSPPVHHKDLKFNTGNLVGSSTCLCVKPHLGWHTFWTSISQVVYGCMVCVFVNALLLCNLITLHISEARNAPHPSRIKTHTHTHKGAGEAWSWHWRRRILLMSTGYKHLECTLPACVRRCASLWSPGSKLYLSGE